MELSLVIHGMRWICVRHTPGLPPNVNYRRSTSFLPDPSLYPSMSNSPRYTVLTVSLKSAQWSLLPRYSWRAVRCGLSVSTGRFFGTWRSMSFWLWGSLSKYAARTYTQRPRYSVRGGSGFSRSRTKPQVIIDLWLERLRSTAAEL